MKTIKFIFCSLLFAGFFWSCGTTSSSTEVKLEQTRIAGEVNSAIHFQNFKIDVSQMSPSGRPSQILTSAYSLEIRNDSVFSYLPYFGRAYTATYGSTSSPLIFNAPIEGYKASYGRKGKTDIIFTTRANEDNFTYRITVFPNASTSININSNNRQTIFFQGTLVLP